MSHADPYAVMRNPATLAAYREYRKAIRRAGQPWVALASILPALIILIAIYAPTHEAFRHSFLFLAFPFLMACLGLSGGIAWIRMAVYRRDHPLRLPKA